MEGLRPCTQHNAGPWPAGEWDRKPPVMTSPRRKSRSTLRTMSYRTVYTTNHLLWAYFTGRIGRVLLCHSFCLQITDVRSKSIRPKTRVPWGEGPWSWGRSTTCTTNMANHFALNTTLVCNCISYELNSLYARPSPTLETESISCVLSLPQSLIPS